MAVLRLDRFGGEIPRLAPHLLPAGRARTAENTRLESGELAAWNDRLASHTPSKSGIKQSIYRFATTPGADDNATITNATQANPVQITSAGHGRTTGDRVYIANVGGMTEINSRTFTITVVDSDNYTLDGEDGTGHSAYTSGGTWVFENGFWFHWTDDVDVVRGPIAGDTEERTYYTGDGAPKMTYAGIATSGGTDYPTNSYLLGVPAPTTAPSVATSGAAGDSDAGNDEDRVYVYTYVSAKGEEGPPSPPSASVTVDPAQTVDVTAMETGPAGNYNITNKRIYRSVTGTNGTDYLYVDEIAVATTSYNDSVDAADLGEVLPSTTWDPPPSDAAGLVALPNGVFAAFAKNELLLCEPYQPHAWPDTYRLATHHPIVGIGAFGNSILVTTESNPYVVRGVDPASMSMEKLEIPQACVSKRGLVDMGYYVLYPSPDGLMMVGQGTSRLATEGLLSKRDWQALAPESIHACYFDGKYIGFYDDGTNQGGFVFDAADELANWYWLDFYATGSFNDPLTDKLYLIVNGDIVQWDGASTQMSYTWRSGTLMVGRPLNMSVARVLADSYPLTCKVYADGALKHTESVADATAFRLPSGFYAREWEIELSGTSTVREVALAEHISELV